MPLPDRSELRAVFPPFDELEPLDAEPLLGADFFVDPPELELPLDFFAAPDAVRFPTAPLFGVSFCAVFEAAFAELFFEPEPADVVAALEAPDRVVPELFAEAFVPEPAADLVVDRVLPFELDADFEPLLFFDDVEAEPDFELLFFFDVAVAMSTPPNSLMDSIRAGYFDKFVVDAEKQKRSDPLTDETRLLVTA